jgi:hypothetical protein
MTGKARLVARYTVVDKLTAMGYDRMDIDEFLTPYDFEAGEAIFVLATLADDRIKRTYNGWYQTVKVNKEHERLMLHAALMGAS